MRKIIRTFEQYSVFITEDDSAFYIENDQREILYRFTKSLPTVIDGVTYYPTHEEVWIVIGDLIQDMERALANFD